MEDRGVIKERGGTHRGGHVGSKLPVLLLQRVKLSVEVQFTKSAKLRLKKKFSGFLDVRQMMLQAAQQ